ncbi:MAG TPA: pyridoxal phosphate-dependent aminotransferase [Burkholderiaceae bacterium]|nr:pyridoxal phosphate-dependent aminotransferase [Burkholderiaceae bacterium]
MLRTSLDALPASRIREVANAALGRADLVKFWFGEGDLPTPGFIREAAKAALDAGDTFYNHNLGIEELRQQIASYLNALHAPRTPIGTDRIAVTSAGVNALSLIAQSLLDPGDRVAIVTPVWPNVTSIPRILGAEVLRVPLDERSGAWSLDLDRLLDAARTARAIVINSPNNPTGWTMPQAQWEAVLAFCRKHGIWIVSDDAYERLVYDASTSLTTGGRIHSTGVLAQVDADERYISANTFSKAWTMTGWRLGWLVAPRSFIANFAKIVEFNTSCAPPFIQRAGIVALREGEALIEQTAQRLRRARDVLARRLRELPGVEAAAPGGAMYFFFRIRGRSDDSLAFAKALATEAGLGVAPGIAFGPEGEGYLRWCFAATEALIEEGVRRLARYLGANAERAREA